jgi:hypothetical protein
MADIFGGAQLPNWLVAQEHESGSLGRSIGTILGGGLLALEPNEEGDGIKGLRQGMYEARMNQTDPNWRVKEKGLEAQLTATWAHAATQWQQYDETQKDMQSWMKEDLPALSEYQDTLKTDPKAVPPVMKSSRGQNAVQQLESAQLRQDALNLRRDQAKDLLESRKFAAEQNSASAKLAGKITEMATESLSNLMGVDPDSAALIGEPQGPVVAGIKKYSDDQIKQIGAALKKNNLPGLGQKAVAPPKPEKPSSPLGKLISDRDAAVKAGADAATIANYNAKIKEESGGDTSVDAMKPHMEQIPNTDLQMIWSPKTGAFKIENTKTKKEAQLSVKDMRDLRDSLPANDPRVKAIDDHLFSLIPGSDVKPAQAGAAKTDKPQKVKVLNIRPAGSPAPATSTGTTGTTAGPDETTAAPAPVGQVSDKTFFGTLQKDWARPGTVMYGNIMDSLAKQMAQKVPIKKDSELLRVGGSTLFHSPEAVYSGALSHGKWGSLTGKHVWDYIMSLPENERSAMFDKALADAGAK